MLPKLKIVLIWLVMLALPVQSFATAIMLDCGVSHHHGAMSHTASREVASHHHADEAEPHVVVEVHVSSDSAHSPGGHDLDGKCSACAGCCLGTALSQPIPAVLSPSISRLPVHISPEKRFAINFPDGLERPPHSFLL
ncbi:hypothetical protein [Herbaspirillum sp. RV1423]|uniref:hypothetical protein n=1 Tax=Herbaspirillum sp. RV1423 TaxID=1443993 RepID=UPI0012DD95E9|nr:hypothetical protein [Herbaspirillum sp. RV1423]